MATRSTKKSKVRNKRKTPNALLHVAPCSVRGTLLFRYWSEARVLWDTVADVPGVRALALMPDHIHVLVAEASLPALKTALRAYALWRNHARSAEGAVWQHGSLGTRPSDDQHGARTIRYIHLNPCRARLAADPLAWPFSTHRDACGLVTDPKVGTMPNPHEFHAEVSADRFVDVAGTSLPAPRISGSTRGIGSLREVFVAVSALTRTPAAQIRERGPARNLFIRAARTYTDAAPKQIAEAAAVSPATVFRIRPKHDARKDPAVQLVGRVLGDPRFGLLTDKDVRRNPAAGWGRYRDRV